MGGEHFLPEVSPVPLPWLPILIHKNKKSKATHKKNITDVFKVQAYT